MDGGNSQKAQLEIPTWNKQTLYCRFWTFEQGFFGKKLQYDFPKMREAKGRLQHFRNFVRFGIVIRPLLRKKTQRTDSHCVHLKNGFKGIIPGMLTIAFSSATQVVCLRRLLSCEKEQILESQLVSEPQQIDFEEA